MNEPDEIFGEQYEADMRVVSGHAEPDGENQAAVYLRVQYFAHYRQRET